MNKAGQNIAVAALDIGTSQIKMGVYYPRFSKKIIQIGSHKNALIFGNTGQVNSDYTETRNKVFDLFNKLGLFVKENKIEQLLIGICGHVSSLLEWDTEKNGPVNNRFPIWMDRTCIKHLDELVNLTVHGNSKDLIGSFLPTGTNWLLTKLIGEKENGFNRNSIFLQIGDAVFAELTGKYQTHFSSQVSMVHQTEKKYVSQFLNYLGLTPNQLPEINNERYSTVLPEIIKTFSLPEETFVFPSIADFYASFIGLQLQSDEAFVLANTSEITGFCNGEKPAFNNRFVNVGLSKKYIQYGSSNSGGNLINWLFENILGKPADRNSLAQLTESASKLAPEDCPLFLPYIEGERAPFWNSKLTASFLGLQSFHNQTHLFRAMLESVAFARRQTLDLMDTTDFIHLKMGGGLTQNKLWNKIRACVINKSIMVSKEKEISILGVIDNVIENQGNGQLLKPSVHFENINPEPDLADIYEKKYAEFLMYQKQLKISNE